MKRLSPRGLYGNSALHALAVVASFTLSGYAILKLYDQPQARNVALWFIGAIIAHDLIAFPIYSALDRIARSAPGMRPATLSAINHIRAPALISGMLLLVYFPLILRKSADHYESATTLSADVYLGRWLLLTGALFLISGIAYAVRLRRAGQSSQSQPSQPAG